MSTAHRHESPSYNLNNLRRELANARDLFPAHTGATSPPPRPVWSDPSTGSTSPTSRTLRAVSPSPWQAVPLGESYKSIQTLDTSGMVSDCGEMESVFARNVDWERVARILAEKLEVAVLETESMRQDRDLSTAQLQRLEKIVETHANAAATCASQLKSYRGNQKSQGTQTAHKGASLTDQQSKINSLAAENEQLCNTLKGVTVDYEQTLEELKRQLEINSKIEQHAAAQSNSNTELTTRQREVNRELANNQGELIELRQKNKKLKKQLAWFKGEGKEGDRTGS